VPTTSISAIVRYNDPQLVDLVPVGEAQLDANLGAVRISQPLDFDLSPGTAMGGNPSLVCNSATIAVKPIIAVLVTPDTGLGSVTMLKVQLTWAGTAEGWNNYFPSNTTPIVIGIQHNTAVAQTGRYDWKMDVEVHYSGGGPWTGSVNGRMSVVVDDSSVAGQIDPYGAGW